MSSDEKKPTGLTATREVTNTLTGSMTGGVDTSIEELIGKESLHVSELRMMLKLIKGQTSKPLHQALKLAPLSGVRLESGAYVPVVLGPYPPELIKTLFEDALISPEDLVLKSFHRWKTLSEMFPDVQRGFGGDESSETGTETALDLTKTAFEEHQDSQLELPKELSQSSLETPKEEASNRVPLPPSEITSVNRVSAWQATPPRTRQVESFRNTLAGNKYFRVMIGLFVLFSVGVYVLPALKMRKEKVTSSTEEDLQREEQRKLDLKIALWPDLLKPRSLEDLYTGDSPLIQKIRPILMAVTQGRTQLSPVEVKTLRSLADPASANWEARLLATNQLASNLLSQNKAEEARKVLSPVLESASTDPVTLLNGALIHLALKDYAQAKDLVATGLRLCESSMCWVAHSLSGLIEAAQLRKSETDKAFRNAIARAPYNPLVYGLWLRALLMLGDTKSLGAVMEELLWSDPDYWTDSPLPAPLAGAFFKNQALGAFLEVSQIPNLLRSSGQMAYIKWLAAKNSANSLPESVAQVTRLLEVEDSLLSQLLLAYVYKDTNNFSDAAATLNKAIPLLKVEKVKSSWPWVLTADVQYARGLMEQSFMLYSAALSRNPQDRAAVLGLALGLREKNDFTGSAQKIAESLTLDSFFIPAQLRVTRFDWQRTAAQN